MTSEAQPSEQTHRARALHLWKDLVPRLEALKILERDLKRRPNQDVHEQTRADMVAVAIEHVELAIAALLRAGQE